MKKQILLAAVLCGLIAAGCGSQQTQSESGSAAGSADTSAEQQNIVTRLPEDEFPAFGGCESLALPGNLAAAAALGTDYESAEALTAFYGSSSEAWQRLLDGDADIILAYDPDEDMQEELEQAGVTMQCVGTDALIFLVPETSAEGGGGQTITQDEILAAYSGEESEWTGYASSPTSSERQLFTQLFGIDSAGVTIQQDGDTLTAACPHATTTANALCYTTYLTVLADGLPAYAEIAAVDGVQPSTDMLTENETEDVGSAETAAGYPLQVSYYVACRGDLDDNDPAMLLYRWLASEDGADWLGQAVAQSAAAPQETQEQAATANAE